LFCGIECSLGDSDLFLYGLILFTDGFCESFDPKALRSSPTPGYKYEGDYDIVENSPVDLCIGSL